MEKGRGRRGGILDLTYHTHFILEYGNDTAAVQELVD